MEQGSFPVWKGARCLTPHPAVVRSRPAADRVFTMLQFRAVRLVHEIPGWDQAYGHHQP